MSLHMTGAMFSWSLILWSMVPVDAVPQWTVYSLSPRYMRQHSVLSDPDAVFPNANVCPVWQISARFMQGPAFCAGEETVQLASEEETCVDSQRVEQTFLSLSVKRVGLDSLPLTTQFFNLKRQATIGSAQTYYVDAPNFPQAGRLSNASLAPRSKARTIWDTLMLPSGALLTVENITANSVTIRASPLEPWKQAAMVKGPVGGAPNLTMTLQREAPRVYADYVTGVFESPVPWWQNDSPRMTPAWGLTGPFGLTLSSMIDAPPVVNLGAIVRTIILPPMMSARDPSDFVQRVTVFVDIVDDPQLLGDNLGVAANQVLASCTGDAEVIIPANEPNPVMTATFKAPSVTCPNCKQLRCTQLLSTFPFGTDNPPRTDDEDWYPCEHNAQIFRKASMTVTWGGPNQDQGVQITDPSITGLFSANCKRTTWTFGSSPFTLYLPMSQPAPESFHRTIGFEIGSRDEQVVPSQAPVARQPADAAVSITGTVSFSDSMPAMTVNEMGQKNFDNQLLAQAELVVDARNLAALQSSYSDVQAPALPAQLEIKGTPSSTVTLENGFMMTYALQPEAGLGPVAGETRRASQGIRALRARRWQARSEGLSADARGSFVPNAVPQDVCVLQPDSVSRPKETISCGSFSVTGDFEQPVCACIQPASAPAPGPGPGGQTCTYMNYTQNRSSCERGRMACLNPHEAEDCILNVTPHGGPVPLIPRLKRRAELTIYGILANDGRLRVTAVLHDWSGLTPPSGPTVWTDHGFNFDSVVQTEMGDTVAGSVESHLSLYRGDPSEELDNDTSQELDGVTAPSKILEYVLGTSALNWGYSTAFNNDLESDTALPNRRTLPEDWTFVNVLDIVQYPPVEIAGRTKQGQVLRVEVYRPSTGVGGRSHGDWLLSTLMGSASAYPRRCTPIGSKVNLDAAPTQIPQLQLQPFAKVAAAYNIQVGSERNMDVNTEGTQWLRPQTAVIAPHDERLLVANEVGGVMCLELKSAHADDFPGHLTMLPTTRMKEISGAGENEAFPLQASEEVLKQGLAPQTYDMDFTPATGMPSAAAAYQRFLGDTRRVPLGGRDNSSAAFAQLPFLMQPEAMQSFDVVGMTGISAAPFGQYRIQDWMNDTAVGVPRYVVNQSRSWILATLRPTGNNKEALWSKTDGTGMPGALAVMSASRCDIQALGPELGPTAQPSGASTFLSAVPFGLGYINDVPQDGRQVHLSPYAPQQVFLAQVPRGADYPSQQFTNLDPWQKLSTVAVAPLATPEVAAERTTFNKAKGLHYTYLHMPYLQEPSSDAKCQAMNGEAMPVISKAWGHELTSDTQLLDWDLTSPMRPISYNDAFSFPRAGFSSSNIRPPLGSSPSSKECTGTLRAFDRPPPVEVSVGIVAEWKNASAAPDVFPIHYGLFSTTDLGQPTVDSKYAAGGATDQRQPVLDPSALRTLLDSQGQPLGYPLLDPAQGLTVDSYRTNVMMIPGEVNSSGSVSSPPVLIVVASKPSQIADIPLFVPRRWLWNPKWANSSAAPQERCTCEFKELLGSTETVRPRCIFSYRTEQGRPYVSNVRLDLSSCPRNAGGERRCPQRFTQAPTIVGVSSSAGGPPVICQDLASSVAYPFLHHAGVMVHIAEYKEPAPGQPKRFVQLNADTGSPYRPGWTRLYVPQPPPRLSISMRQYVNVWLYNNCFQIMDPSQLFLVKQETVPDGSYRSARRSFTFRVVLAEYFKQDHFNLGLRKLPRLQLKTVPVDIYVDTSGTLTSTLHDDSDADDLPSTGRCNLP